jgi:hypothetical protein
VARIGAKVTPETVFGPVGGKAANRLLGPFTATGVAVLKNRYKFVVMKPGTAIALFIVSASTLSPAETFVGPTATNNHLLVSSNSAIIITATFGNFTNSTAVAMGGAEFPQSYFAPLVSGSSYALAGPAELIFSNEAVITYYQVTNSAIITQGVANDPIGIPIGSNQTMRLFGVWAPVNANFSSFGSGSASFMLEPGQPAEFTGPGTLSLNSGEIPPAAKFISYFIAENGFAIPNQRFIAGPTGSFAITVEKSFDLNTWSPVLLGNTADDTSAYYRLRIQH